MRSDITKERLAAEMAAKAQLSWSQLKIVVAIFPLLAGSMKAQICTALIAAGELDPTKIDWVAELHTSSSMIKKGVYPAGATLKEVEAEVRGTFGGRFEYFRDGKFKYIAYTD